MAINVKGSSEVQTDKKEVIGVNVLENNKGPYFYGFISKDINDVEINKEHISQAYNVQKMETVS